MSTASWFEAVRPREHWRALIGTRGPGVMAGLLAIALAAEAALLVTNLAGGTLPPPTPLSAWHPHAGAPDTARIVASHLFGRAPQGHDALDTDAPHTRLPLVLTGVIAAAEPTEGLAILGPNAHTSRVYAVGDTVPGGATLDAVLPRKVLLRQNGSLQSLPLPRHAPASAPPPSAAALPSSETSAPKFAARMRALVRHRPGILARLLRPEPVFSGGHQLGYRVYPGSDPAAFQRLGLKPGDLVLDINGTPLNDAAQDQQILNTLGSSSEATVTVLRHGQHHTLTLNLAQVEQAAQSLTAAPKARHAASGGAHPQPFGAGHPPSTPPQ